MPLNEIREFPILFSAPMVRAILDERKTQTRRVAKFPSWVEQFTDSVGGWFEGHGNHPVGPCEWSKCAHIHGDAPSPSMYTLKCPYGQPGDRLWVREAWQAWTQFNHLPPRAMPKHTPNYLADGNKWDARYRHARFMPRWASRITLEITEVRVQRLQDISEEDCLAEGVSLLKTNCDGECGMTPCGISRQPYSTLWESINGIGSWERNDWIWAISFKRI